MLEIIPAIDLLGGQAVRLKQGDYATNEKVADDPIKTAEGFARAGATRLHIVDLDGARTGEGHNQATIRAIISSVPQLSVQVGGGVRSMETIASLLDAGAKRVIVGTSAAQNADLAREMLSAFGDRIIIGADSKDGQIAVRGWEATTGETTAAFCLRMKDLGAARFLFTDVARDGMLQGANVEATAQLAQMIGLPVLASGGVANLDDIAALCAVQPNGVEGVIIGKALYASRFTLADALRIATEN